ncbi:type II toxin-antitoxin system Phd/YefM family antitoxin [Sorangium sp. So ce388]|uniref:type II toxin-antitoxin system Phd/YefM family antitoxin n=1 Tax=Sorangium sp. So ce388 TaxID=3133309 RepID=UPI003F5B95E9
MQRARLNIVIPADHRIELKLPDELPPGPAEVIVEVVVKARKVPNRRDAIGKDVGNGWIAEDFDAPLPDEIQRAFEGET